LATSSAFSASTAVHGAIVTLQHLLLITPIAVIANLVPFAQTFGPIALLDVDEDIFRTIIWRNEAEPFVSLELLHRACRCHNLVLLAM